MKKQSSIRLLILGRRFAQAFFFIAFLVLLFYFCWPYRFDYNSEAPNQIPNVELFLLLDPLVSVSTAIASKAMVRSLPVAAIVLLICIVYPRWFCGYVCPMGTLIDIFDWSISSRIKRFRIKKRGWWVNLRFFALTIILISALFGVLLSGFAAAIPTITRGMIYIFAPLQIGLLKGWDSVPQLNIWQYISILLFMCILALGLLFPRFWCAHVCPSGALLSLPGILSLKRRHVDETCLECGKCLQACCFGAISHDFSTSHLNCALCQSCVDICPKNSIKFVSRWNKKSEKSLKEGVTVQPSFARRSFLFGIIGAAGAGIGAAAGLKIEREGFAESYPLRPPGSMPEDEFRSQCIRCGECLKVCPGNVLQPAGIELGLDGIWTPKITADFSGCKPYCNNCGQVCPTGAIRKLPLEEKRAARIGLAQVNTQTCLPHSQRENCGLCLDECAAAGYNAIEFISVGMEYDNNGIPVPGSGFLAPVVQEDKCVGCGLCQARCHAANVEGLKLLSTSAIKVKAGPGKEDRIVTGSYIELRDERLKSKKHKQIKATESDYLPDFLR